MRQRHWRRIAALAMLSAWALALTACATSVNRILSDPSRYRDREAKLSGEVIDSYSFGGRGVYRIDDRTGQLWIVSDRGVPRKGAWVKVTGTIREGFNLGMLGDRVKLPMGVSSGVVMVETSHKARF